jgi:hypothetical protein
MVASASAEREVIVRIHGVLLVLPALMAAAACCQKEESTVQELERIYTTVRRAFAEYDLDAARPYLQVPEDEPEPTREQAKMMADFLPDLEKSRFIDLVEEGDRAAYYALTSLEEDGTEVTVVRFRHFEPGWKLVAGPHTMNSYSTDEALDDAGIRKLMAEKEELQPFPEGAE